MPWVPSKKKKKRTPKPSTAVGLAANWGPVQQQLDWLPLTCALSGREGTASEMPLGWTTTGLLLPVLEVDVLY